MQHKSDQSHKFLDEVEVIRTFRKKEPWPPTVYYSQVEVLSMCFMETFQNAPIILSFAILKVSSPGEFKNLPTKHCR